MFFCEVLSAVTTIKPFPPNGPFSMLLKITENAGWGHPKRKIRKKWVTMKIKENVTISSFCSKLKLKILGNVISLWLLLVPLHRVQYDLLLLVPLNRTQYVLLLLVPLHRTQYVLLCRRGTKLLNLNYNQPLKYISY